MITGGIWSSMKRKRYPEEYIAVDHPLVNRGQGDFLSAIGDASAKNHWDEFC